MDFDGRGQQRMHLSTGRSVIVEGQKQWFKLLTGVMWITYKLL